MSARLDYFGNERTGCRIQHDRGAGVGERLTIRNGVHAGKRAVVFRTVTASYLWRVVYLPSNAAPLRIGDKLARVSTGENVVIRDGRVM